ncbi:vesicle transport through interaction with t-SNAREs homolog 1B-like [Sycon ciliatum]|uniref:vesicle transport through interaction with t-SNAREs homolog 1B-like n=1 Tax=Sycon ciliatum TaxID=27933 RepID=UPI0020ACEC1D|eukprot:scpid66270/ scgid11619/ Vesicle transport through interaction with t-SNAREs homolog 1B
MSSEKFEDIEDDFRLSLDSLRKLVEDKIPKLSGEQRRSAARDAERQAEDCQHLLGDMDGELQHAPPSYRTQMGNKYRSYKRDFTRLRQSLKQLTSAAPGGAGGPAYSRPNEVNHLEHEQRSQLLQGTNALERASQSVARSNQISAETDQIGVEILGELDGQREQLLNARDRVIETDQEMSRSRKLIQGLARRVLTNKLIMIIIILLELAILGGVCYWKFH